VSAAATDKLFQLKLYCRMGSVREGPKYDNDVVADSVRFRR